MWPLDFIYFVIVTFNLFSNAWLIDICKNKILQWLTVKCLLIWFWLQNMLTRWKSVKFYCCVGYLFPLYCTEVILLWARNILANIWQVWATSTKKYQNAFWCVILHMLAKFIEGPLRINGTAVHLLKGCVFCALREHPQFFVHSCIAHMWTQPKAWFQRAIKTPVRLSLQSVSLLGRFILPICPVFRYHQ